MDPGGDDRLGLQIAGAILIVLGFGVGAFLNLAVHIAAGSGGMTIGPWTVTATMGPYAWGLLLFGFFTGVLGVAFLFLARDSRKGPIVLPGFPY
jgi:hypothetical protein